MQNYVATAPPSTSAVAAPATTTTAGDANMSYDTSANSYADNITRFTMLHAADLIGVTKTEIRKAKRILEIGCGAGAFGLAYMNIFPQGIPGQTIVCTDLSPTMVQVAQRLITEKTQKQHQSSSFSTEFIFHQSDGTTLEGLGDKSFDLVVSVFGVFLIPNRTAVFQQIRRVLVDGGALATTAWTSTGYNEELQKAGFGPNLHDAMAMMKVLPKGSSPEDRTLQPLPQFVLDWFDRDKIKDMLRENNLFLQLDIYRSMHTVAFDSVDHMWHTFTSSSPHARAAGDQEDPEQVALAKKSLGQFVTQSPHEETVDRPICVQTVANIIVAS
jgi:ubiquinone/menaquinone biosynthesis C-methylase UbiE